MQSIFTTYFEYILEPAREALGESSYDTSLKTSVLQAMTSSFKHDQDGKVALAVLIFQMH